MSHSSMILVMLEKPAIGEVWRWHLLEHFQRIARARPTYVGPSEQIQRGGREQLTPIATYSRVLPRQCYRTGLSQADGSNLGFGQGQLRLSPPGRGQCCVPPQQSTSGVTRSTQRAADRCGNRFLTHLTGA